MVEYRHPVRGVRTQGLWANPNNGANGAAGHLGIDVACAKGTPVRACGDGVIEFSNWATNLPGGIRNKWAFLPDAAGGLVIINHGPGEPSTGYGHMLETYFNPGDFVKGGTIIGLADSTGLSTGHHLHYDFIMVDRVVAPRWGRVNPDDYCRGYWDDAPVAGGGIVDNKVDNLFVTGPDGARRREAPDKNARLIDEFLPDRELTIGGYVRAKEPPYPGRSNIWLIGGLNGGYFWLESFVNQDISAIPDLTPAITPPPTPPGVPDTPPVVVAPPYDFVLDFTEINGIVVEKIPAANSNVDTGNMPERVTDLVKHWWNDPELRPQWDGVSPEFTTPGKFKSPHWMVSEYRIAQFVAMKDRAYHAGPEGNNAYGVEIDPRVVEKDSNGNYTATALRIQENVKALHRQIELKNGYEIRARLHNEFMNTKCAGIDLLMVEPDRSVPAPEPAPTPTELDAFLVALEGFIQGYRNK